MALAGLVFLAGRAADRDAARIAVCALVMVLAQIYIAGSVGSWTVAGAFGQRRFLSLTVLLAPGVAAAIQWARRSRTRVLEPAVWTLVAVCVWWNIGLMAQFGSGTMDRQRLELSRNAYYTFVVFPLRVPSLARRYLLERETLTPAQLQEVVRAAAGIDSDHYKSELLIDVLRRHRLDSATREAFLDAVDTISSSHYRGQVADALLRSERAPGG